MIDKEKIIAARVAARLGDSEELPTCNYEDFCRNYEGIKPLMHRKWLEYEIRCKPTEEKVRLAKHHAQEIHKYMEYKLSSEPLNGKQEFIEDIRPVCSTIEDFPSRIIERLAPVFVAFDILDPDHQLRKNFESATAEFEAEVAAVRNQFPNGKGVYKKRLKKLVPIGQKYLRKCLNITSTAIEGYSPSQYL